MLHFHIDIILKGRTGMIKAYNLIYEYENNKKALYGVDLDIKPGEFISIVGHNGSGKSTLLLMLDWRIALAGWGLFLLLWLTTRYVSLGSVAAAVSFPISTFFCFRTPVLTVLSLLIAGLVLWAHRGNIVRLVQGKESKFRWHGKEDKT